MIDRTDGQTYAGQTVGAAGKSGEITATVDGADYSTYVCMKSGGALSVGSSRAGVNGPRGTAVLNGSSTDMALPTSGGGLINMRSTAGQVLRCSFSLNEFGNTGLSECQRGDGRLYDLTIKR